MKFAAAFAFLSVAAWTAFAQDAPTSDCVPMCMQVKFNEAPNLAPQCQTSDLQCLCLSGAFGRAFQRCLSENCPSSEEVAQGSELLDQICSDAGVAMGTFSANPDDAAQSTAVQNVASLLAASVSGDAPPPPVSFFPDSAVAHAGARATASAQAALSQAQEQASLSLSREAAQASSSFARIIKAASATQAALATQLSGSDFDRATEMIAATLSAMQAAATSQLDAERAAAEASLAAASTSMLNRANPTNATTNAVSSSAALRSEVQAGLGFLALLWLLI